MEVSLDVMGNTAVDGLLDPRRDAVLGGRGCGLR
jgi:hypothetical protein